MNPFRDVTDVLYKSKLHDDNITISYTPRSYWEASTFVYIFLFLSTWGLIDFFFVVEFGIILTILFLISCIPTAIALFRRLEIKDQEMKTPIWKVSIYKDILHVYPTKTTYWSQRNERAGKVKEPVKINISDIVDIKFYSLGENRWEDEYFCVVAITDEELTAITPCFFKPSNCLKLLTQ